MSALLRYTSLFTLAVACNGGKDSAEEEDPSEHACEHISEAGTSVTASSDPASAPSISVGEEPYTISLVSGEAGYISATVDADTPALLFVGEADVVTSLQHDGAEETLPAPAPNELCPDDIPEHFDLDLHAGTWVIGLGPVGITDVWLMLASSEGHAH